MLIDFINKLKCLFLTGGDHNWQYDWGHAGEDFVVGWKLINCDDKKCVTRRTCKHCRHSDISIAVDTWADGVKWGWIDSKHLPLTREKILTYGEY